LSFTIQLNNNNNKPKRCHQKDAFELCKFSQDADENNESKSEIGRTFSWFIALLPPVGNYHAM